MKGNRPKKQVNEALPQIEVIKHEQNHEVRYNFSTLEATEETPESFNYEYVKVPYLTKKAVKVAIIRTRYPDFNDELSVINNKESGVQSDLDAYSDYQQFRMFAETKANDAINAEV